MEAFKEFKKFALKGNMIDMAIGIVIGAAFGTVMMDFASNACSTCFPDGLPGEGADPTAPIAYADYEGFDAIHDYSNLDYLEYRTTLGARYKFHNNVGIFGQQSDQLRGRIDAILFYRRLVLGNPQKRQSDHVGVVSEFFYINDPPS